MRKLFVVALCAALGLATVAEAKRKPPEAVRMIDLKDAKVADKKGKASEPTVIKTEDDLKKAVGDDAAKAMAIDFKKEYLALFVWAGSGGDKLTHATETKDGKTTVTTNLTRGLTKDLKQHAELVALPVGAEWAFAAAAKPADPVKPAEPKKEEPKKEEPKKPDPVKPADPKPAEPKKEEPKKEEPKKEEPKPEFKGDLRVVDLTGVKAAEKKDGKAGEPTVIKSEDELKKAVGEETAKKMTIDFKKEYLAMFQWNGPIGDTLTHATEKKDGKMMVTTTLTAGAGDKVNHVALIALPVGADWKFGK